MNDHRRKDVNRIMVELVSVERQLDQVLENILVVFDTKDTANNPFAQLMEKAESNPEMVSQDDDQVRDIFYVYKTIECLTEAMQELADAYDSLDESKA